ncbi:Transcription factor [Cordyceps fumosorosea ARSEF 2679]|uniref:Transcription factor n=1 Tax=Cordyceps fumosorosea (strain ARSEF 2679) TaxID=1081104 RepID=A0A167TQX4_CORFA|nr:Transcription factor [Cordyceps fumosorosea ARSEF 2679]OAA60854.1 Transcription factor [Cordyceps fumosorosea ARSEF 2679]
MEPQDPSPGPSTDGGSVKPFSCLVCRQRKVRCDRVQPCGNCKRARAECEYVAPVRGKRKRSKPSRETLHAKLRRYEEMLTTRGVDVGEKASTRREEEVEGGGDEDGLSEGNDTADSLTSFSVTTPGGEAAPSMGLRSALIRTPGSGPKLVSKEGNSRYYENSTLWTDITDDFRHPDEYVPVGDDDDDDDEPEADIFLGSSSSNSFNGQLRDWHPTIHCLYALRDIYVDRVDPLMKIMHMPTFWALVLQAAERKEDVSRPIEAVMFCFYFATISVIEEKECQKLFNESKKTMFAKYRAIARHTLKRAGLLSTTSPMTLRAFCLFMMGLRGTMRYESQHILCGIALRLAQKMGLHRDGTSLGLSIFETEMRRRLWWYVAHLDFRTSDLLGAKPSLDIHTGDAGLPWNVEDEDLQPSMTEVPKDRKAITSITMCLVRCDLAKSLQRLSGTPATTSAASWGDIGTGSRVPPADKDALIDAIEDRFETKYLRYCDPSRPLDMLVSCMIRAAVCNTRLFAHNPRRFADSAVAATPAERDVAFRNAAKLLEYASMVGEHAALRKYEWRLNSTYLWDKILFVLIEARRRGGDAELDGVWRLIGRVFAQYPDAFGQSSARAVYRVLSRWTLEVWDGYVAARRAVAVAGMPEPEEPAYIKAMREKREVAGEVAAARTSEGVVVDTAALGSSGGAAQTAEPPAEEGYSGFSDLGSFEMNLDEWVNWDQLVSEQTGFFHVEGY